MQRFFAVFELASAPFTKSVGPHDFVSSDFISATNFRLRGPGTIGRSSHHSIHGNDNENVEIEGVTFVDFEVGAVSLNNVKGLEVKNCDIPHNRHDVPVLGIFSAALQIRPFLKYLKETQPSYTMLLGGAVKTVEEVYDALVSSIASVYKDVKEYGAIQEENVNYELFHNPERIIDGPCYAFLVHGKGKHHWRRSTKLMHSYNPETYIHISVDTRKRTGCWRIWERNDIGIRPLIR